MKEVFFGSFNIAFHTADLSPTTALTVHCQHRPERAILLRAGTRQQAAALKSPQAANTQQQAHPHFMHTGQRTNIL